jgi:hypothetical protein
MRAVRLAFLVPALAAVALCPRAVRAQQAATTAATASAPVIVDDRAHFEILAVGDSTFTFALGTRRWVATGAHGDAVDPRRRNALVARFEVTSVAGGVATALIVGETTRLNTTHVALLDAPREMFYRKSTFWGGVLAGVVAGAGLTAAFK